MENRLRVKVLRINADEVNIVFSSGRVGLGNVHITDYSEFTSVHTWPAFGKRMENLGMKSIMSSDSYIMKKKKN